MSHSRPVRSQLTIDFGVAAATASTDVAPDVEFDAEASAPAACDRLDAPRVPTPPTLELEPAPVWSIALDHWLATQSTEATASEAPAPVKRRRTRTRTVADAL
ncbi:MAG: hypothetical protein J6S08_03575 [Duodenibacillus sp.]|nr:hypothetical protein [Duodenibacillus sp.]